MPIRRLLNEDYAAGLRSSLRPDKALPSAMLSGHMAEAPDGPHTTHFSIIDAEGNRVAATLSVNFPFGAGMVAAGTGVVLNDEMDDFVSLPGAMGTDGRRKRTINTGNSEILHHKISIVMVILKGWSVNSRGCGSLMLCA